MRNTFLIAMSLAALATSPALAQGRPGGAGGGPGGGMGGGPPMSPPGQGGGIGASDAARVLVRQGGSDVVRDVSWEPDAPEAMVEALRALVGAPSAFVVIVGLGFLEVAEPELPPLDASARQALLWRDADRYFPIAEPVAVACANGVAMALSATRLKLTVGLSSARSLNMGGSKISSMMLATVTVMLSACPITPRRLCPLRAVSSRHPSAGR